jgi:hypothetical protein
LRGGWKWNPARRKGNQNEPEVIPTQPLKPHLIEGPVVIRATKAKKKPRFRIRDIGRCES